MRKKSLSMLIVAICLVAVIGAGATLAYLSDVTVQADNTFTVGKVQANLKEYSDANDTFEWNDEKDGKDLIPGANVIKRPVLTVEADSAPCYVFLKVRGADALESQGFEINGWSDQWERVIPQGEIVLGHDCVYKYKDIVPASEKDQALPPLFTSVTFKNTVEQQSYEAGGIKIIGCAVQASGMADAKAALKEAPADFAIDYVKPVSQ